MNKTEVTSIIKQEINKFISDSLDNEIKKILAKKGSKTRNELIKTIADSMEGVYKLLWQKRDFWKKDIK